MDEDCQDVRHAFMPKRMPGPMLKVHTKEQLRKNYGRAIDFFELFSHLLWFKLYVPLQINMLSYILQTNPGDLENKVKVKV